VGRYNDSTAVAGKHPPALEAERCSSGPRGQSLGPGRDLQRHLSVSREQEIASNLAFLAATTDDSLRVMAVCVEERPDGRGATVRVASNTGDLTAVTSGLRMLATTLEQAARRGQSVPSLD
jgi:hypothetical protein